MARPGDEFGIDRLSLPGVGSAGLIGASGETFVCGWTGAGVGVRGVIDAGKSFFGCTGVGAGTAGAADGTGAGTDGGASLWITPGAMCIFGPGGPGGSKFFGASLGIYTMLRS